MALQKILDILRNARNERTVLADTLPQGKEKVCGVFMLEKEIDFINEDIGLSPSRLVRCNSIEDIIKHHKHPDRHQCSAEIVNVIADQALLGIHIGFTRKGIKAAACKEFQRERNILCFRFRLRFEFFIEIFQRRCPTAKAASHISVQQICRTAVNERLLLRSEVAYRLLTQGQHILGFQRNGVLPVGIVHIDVHGIDMILARCRDFDVLSPESI